MISGGGNGRGRLSDGEAGRIRQLEHAGKATMRFSHQVSDRRSCFTKYEMRRSVTPLPHLLEVGYAFDMVVHQGCRIGGQELWDKEKRNALSACGRAFKE